MSDIRNNIVKLPFWNMLTDKQRDYAIQSSSIRKVQKGALVYSRDCACVGLVYVIKGDLRIYSMSPEGREITLFHVEAGEPCVLSASCVAGQLDFDTHMTAECDSELLIINAPAFARLTEENIHARCFLYEQAAASFSAVMKTIESILFMRFDARLASFLIEEYESRGQRELHITQSGIAERINSAREVVARMLKQFSENALVKTSRGSIIILDPEGLRAITER